MHMSFFLERSLEGKGYNQVWLCFCLNVNFTSNIKEYHSNSFQGAADLFRHTASSRTVRRNLMQECPVILRYFWGKNPNNSGSVEKFSFYAQEFCNIY